MGGVTIDYSAAKGAIVAMTKDMAAYLAPYSMRVKCISSGGFCRKGLPEKFCKAYSKTFMLERQGQEGKELKGTVVFLASEASSFITAHNLVVDGANTVVNYLVDKTKVYLFIECNSEEPRVEV